ncbi:alpha-amylase family glycosyl hydrolase [Clostridium sp. DL1XJH146]
MAKNTDISLRNSTIYSVYVRNHTDEGTFNGVVKDLDRIKDLGIDILWLLPIHPIGQVNKKGQLGCPYSIEDYRKVNDEYGTLEDFKKLIKEAHNRGMRLIIDVVYNHTSHNSRLQKEKPNLFYKKENGEFGNKVGEWTDIIDLDYKNKELWRYQIETLKYWVNIGVDGFRCDVAPLIPKEFWLEAREEVSKINEDVIWLAETSGLDFIEELRKANVLIHNDNEMFQAFDICYDYDTYGYFQKYKKGEISLEQLLDKKRIQDYIYPENYVKLRFIENHDQPRAAYLVKDEIELKNWTAFMFFEKGTSLVYAGQEVKDINQPSLFDKDLVNWKDEKEFTNFMKKLIEIKRNQILKEGFYGLEHEKKIGVIEASYTLKENRLIGVFNIESKVGSYQVDLKDGLHKNLINDSDIEVIDGKFELIMDPIIIKTEN